MSENPYAGYPSERRRDDFDPDEPSRISILAVLSLVCAVICCIPGLGILAFILGVAALAGINRSQGRVTGKALAGVGIALGVLATVVWIALAIGFAQGWRTYTTQIVGGTSQMMQTISDGDIAGVRTHLLATADADVTDEEIAAFAAIIRRDFGEYIDAPTGFSDMMEGFAQAYGGGNVGGNGRNQDPAIPVAVNYTNGSTVVHIVIDPQSFNTSRIRVQDLFIILPSRKALTLRADGPATTAAVAMGFDPVHVGEIGPIEGLPALPAPATTPDEPDPNDDASPM